MQPVPHNSCNRAAPNAGPAGAVVAAAVGVVAGAPLGDVVAAPWPVVSAARPYGQERVSSRDMRTIVDTRLGVMGRRGSERST